MPKINLYPSPNTRPVSTSGGDNIPPAWDETGARRRIEVGYQGKEFGGGVQIATTMLRPGADRHQHYSPAPEGPDVPYTPSWEGWFVDLDRAGVNDLIRALRTARDKSYGADE